MDFDPRTIATPVYKALQSLRSQHTNDDKRLKEQKKQAVELYTYLSTWGMMRLKAEERALSQAGKQDVVHQYFQCLQTILKDQLQLAPNNGLDCLKELDTEDYLGLTGLGLEVAKEFGFWATAVYHDVSGEASE